LPAKIILKLIQTGADVNEPHEYLQRFPLDAINWEWDHYSDPDRQKIASCIESRGGTYKRGWVDRLDWLFHSYGTFQNPCE